MSSRASWAALALILLAGLALRGLVIAQDLDFLVQRVVPDDAFIYYQVARHLAHGEGATFDGITGTNGFHPLWMAVLIPVFRGADGVEAVRLALGLCAALDAATLVLLYLLARRLVGPGWALAPGLLWYLNPVALRESLNGMETALALAVAAGTLLAYHRLDPRTWRDGLPLGVLCGLCLLARTDQVFLVGVLLLHLLLVRRAAAAAFTAGAVAVAMLAPFLAWNQAVFGSPVQASASAYPLVIVANHQQQFGTGLAANLAKSWTMLWATFVEFPPRMTGLGWLLGVLVAGLAAALAWPGPPEDRERIRQGARYLALPLAALVLLALFHAGWRWFPRRWYFFFLVPLVSLYAALWFRWLQDRRAGVVAAAFLVGAGAMFVSDAHRLSTDPTAGYPWQGGMLQAARWIDGNVPPGDRVGSFNAGIVAYFSRHTVVNLDGLGNSRALQALEERRLADLVEEMDLRWLADFEYSVFQDYEHFYGRDLPLRPVADLPGATWSNTPYRIWRLEEPP